MKPGGITRTFYSGGTNSKFTVRSGTEKSPLPSYLILLRKSNLFTKSAVFVLSLVPPNSKCSSNSNLALFLDETGFQVLLGCEVVRRKKGDDKSKDLLYIHNLCISVI